MSFTTWISDPNIHLDELTLTTKSQSYVYGRRLYTFLIGEQKYWLKFHQGNINEVLESAFQRELDVYQHLRTTNKNILLPHQIIQFKHAPMFHELVDEGSGLLLIDADEFFTDISAIHEIEVIKQKINDALDILGHLHTLGWLHGDLKATHFRLYANSCRLIDFEQSIQQGIQLQSLNATPHYMAPELFHGKTKTIQSDLYALGIILYEWLSQTRLNVRTYHDWAVLHCQQLQLQLPNRLKAFLPLLNGLTQKRFEQRFNSVFEAKKALNPVNLF